MIKYPIGIQSFETIRRDGYIYVDKTDLVYKLAQGHIYFLSRPRRFGKSLLVSTLKAYFEGRKDLFQGLMLGLLENRWTDYPVLIFDFNGVDKDVPECLINYINQMLSVTEAKYNLPCFDTKDIALRFRMLIPRIHEATGQRVVVLIDEYDKPLLDLLETDSPNDEPKLDANRELLKNFFSVFKSVDDHLRFVLLTGVTKFSQVSMFSGFNQPDDISFEQDYEALCGITQIELETVFNESIRELSASLHVSQEEALSLLKQNYDGYHFSKRMTDVYNPFSVINALKKRSLEDFWFASGTPSYLVRLLGNTPEDVMLYTNRDYTRDMFVNYKADSSKPLPMLFQAGYLTIKGYDKEFNTYRLDFPNNEVKQGMITLLANDYLKQEGMVQSAVIKIVRALRDGDLEQVRKLFTGFLAETPYTMRPKKDQKDRELYFHYTFYLLMRLISCYTVYTEKQLSEGLADCIIETPKYVYIFEFKLDGTADEALAQIDERGYGKPYEADGRQVYFIGASFSSQTGTVEEWKAVLKHMGTVSV